MLHRPLLVALAVTLAAATVYAECFTLTAKYVMSEPGFEVVFAGRAVHTVHIGERVSRVTFEVNRVWKGSVPARVDVYVAEFIAEKPHFSERTESVVLARKLKNAELRRAAGLSDSAAATELEAMTCSDAHEPNIAQKLGRSYPPTRK